MRYLVQATIVHTAADGARIGGQVPTFFLDSDVQGITDIVHATHVALGVLDPLQIREAAGLEFHISVSDERGEYLALDSRDA